MKTLFLPFLCHLLSDFFSHHLNPSQSSSIYPTCHKAGEDQSNSELFADLWGLSREPHGLWWERAWQEAGVIDWRRWGHCLLERWSAVAVTGVSFCPLNLQSLLMGKIEEPQMKHVMAKRDGKSVGDPWDTYSKMEIKRGKEAVMGIRTIMKMFSTHF